MVLSIATDLTFLFSKKPEKASFNSSKFTMILSINSLNSAPTGSAKTSIFFDNLLRDFQALMRKKNRTNSAQLTKPANTPDNRFPDLMDKNSDLIYSAVKNPDY